MQVQNSCQLVNLLTVHLEGSTFGPSFLSPAFSLELGLLSAPISASTSFLLFISHLFLLPCNATLRRGNGTYFLKQASEQNRSFFLNLARRPAVPQCSHITSPFGKTSSMFDDEESALYLPAQTFFKIPSQISINSVVYGLKISSSSKELCKTKQMYYAS